MSARDELDLLHAAVTDDPRRPARLLDAYRAEVLAERDAAKLADALELGEGADAFIAEYDARKRAEVLAEAADFFEGVLKETLHPEKDARYWSAVHDMVRGLRCRAEGGDPR